MPSGYKHGDTPAKAMVRGTISYLESQGLPVNKSAIFRHFDLSRSQGYAALSASPVPKRDDPEWGETRGRPSKIADAEIAKMDQILWDPKYEDVSLNWSGLAEEAGLEVKCNRRTLHRAMGTLSYRRCLVCGRTNTLKRHREKRSDFARKALQAYPLKEDWRRVRFSGELHFGFGLDGKMRLTPRAGEKLCSTCEQEPTNAWPRDIRRLHAWAAVGYGFKSELVFYDSSTSPKGTGAMSMPDYCDKVLDKVVKPWLTASGPMAFVLEEDADVFAHGSASKINLAQQWKDMHGLRCTFSCGESPDLSPLDSLWPPNKQWTSELLKEKDKDKEKERGWEDETLKKAAREAWAALSQERVNMWVDAMPQRLQLVVEMDGRMVPW
ncbi:hypothetical protein BBK36DRAFT_1158632 [Trichoderma citrinoviride]|uniref:Uncharacterized protein n=1 Tax=Trichoderma citrinoviride TaxID=58853 RepID=A0A2T4BBH3_9HYPO|nr:hypothetical protein BBK36DRAFT_1158632 [Trichoderma citrinoviride]PTB66667.1 hypothetical protein BBK36DRAFT_1158632 [Trichoderma citrinoviride]